MDAKNPETAEWLRGLGVVFYLRVCYKISSNRATGEIPKSEIIPCL